MCFTALHTFRIPRKRDNVLDCNHSSYQKTEQADAKREVIQSLPLRDAQCLVVEHAGKTVEAIAEKMADLKNNVQESISIS